MKTGTSLLVSAEGSEILKHPGCLWIYVLQHKQTDMEIGIFLFFQINAKKPPTLHFLKVSTKDLALQYNWGNPIDTKGAAPVPPAVQTKLPPLQGLFSLWTRPWRGRRVTPQWFGVRLTDSAYCQRNIRAKGWRTCLGV